MNKMQRAIFSTEFLVATHPDLPRFAAGWGRVWEQRVLCGSVGVHWSKPCSGASTNQQRAMPICILHVLKRMEDFLLPSAAGAAGTWPDQQWQSNLLNPAPGFPAPHGHDRAAKPSAQQRQLPPSPAPLTLARSIYQVVRMMASSVMIPLRKTLRSIT